MGWLTDTIDRITGASLRERRRIAVQLSESNAISRRSAERIADKIGVDLPESQRRWESGKTTRLNAYHWANVNGQPINADMASWLTDIRNRCEYEAANNPLVEGMIRTATMCIVGPEGPQLSLVTENDTYRKRRSQVWANWSANAGSNQQLSLVEIVSQWVRSMFTAGEFVTQMIRVSDLDGVQMRLLPIHPRRLMTNPASLGDPEVALGVRRDLEYRRPVAYQIMRPYVFGPYEVYQGKFDEIPFRDIVHGFRMVEEDQVRGIPWLASCLNNIAELRDFKNETLDAARAAADWSVFLHTEHPDAPYLQVNETTSFERRTIKNMPPGWKPSQMAPAHPGPQYDTFYKSLTGEVGMPICMPLMMLLLDSSNHNYSSARFDAQMFWRCVASLQGWFGRILNRIENEVAHEAELAGMISEAPEDLGRDWIWPKPPHVDPVKEREAERMALENGDMTYAELCAAHGKTVESVIASRARDNKSLRDAGLPPIPGIPDGNKMGGDGRTQSTKPSTDEPAPKPNNGNGYKNGRLASVN